MISHEKISNTTEYSVVATSLLLAVFLIFRIEFARIPLILFFSATIIDILANRRWRDWNWSKEKWIFIAMAAYYLCGPLWHLFETTDMYLYKREMENRLPFIAFAVIGLIGWIPQKLRPQHFALTMSATAIICWIVTAVFLYRADHFAGYWWDVQWNFGQMRIRLINSHMIYNLYANTALVMCLYSYSHSNSPVWRSVYAILGILLLAIVLVSEGRTGLLTGCAILTIYGGWRLFRWHWWSPLPFAAIAVAATLFVYSHHARNINNEGTTGNARIYIWNVAVKVIKEKPLLGYGINDGRMAFVEKGLADDGFHKHYVDKIENLNENQGVYRTHPHNVFLEAWINFGIIGVILLLSVYLLPPLTVRGDNWIYASLIVATFGIQSLFETFGWGIQPFQMCWMITYFSCRRTKQ